MKHTHRLLSAFSRRTFLQGSAGTLAASAGLLEDAQAETLYSVETPELRSRAKVEAVLGKAPKPAAESSLRPLTILFAGGAKDHLPKTHSHDVLPKRWKTLLGGAGPGDEAMLPSELMVHEARCTLSFATHDGKFAGWKEWMSTSDDSCETWSTPAPAPGRLHERTFIRNHIVTRDGRILLSFLHYLGAPGCSNRRNGVLISNCSCGVDDRWNRL